MDAYPPDWQCRLDAAAERLARAVAHAQHFRELENALLALGWAYEVAREALVERESARNAALVAEVARLRAALAAERERGEREATWRAP